MGSATAGATMQVNGCLFGCGLICLLCGGGVFGMILIILAIFI
jgi:hypothetical protein